MPTHADTFQSLCRRFREARLLSSSAELLEWDERTGMPPKANAYRAEQVSHLSGLSHRQRTDPVIADELASLADWEEAADPHSPTGATLRLLQEDFEKESRVPPALVQKIASATVRGQGVWDAARKANDYARFKPMLDEIIGLQREFGQCLAREGQTTYEALLDQYEPGARAAPLTEVFRELRSALVTLLDEIESSGRSMDEPLLQVGYSVEKQKVLSRRLAEAIGFDFERGRLDETSHPFCTTLGPSDCRILTRYHERFLPTSIFGTLHEAGHGMYEQGLPEDWFGLPAGTYASLGIHESQSRLWENQVGRSLAFWERFHPLMQELFPTQAKPASAEDWHRCFHRVERSLVRVEADEATYNLHIIVRFELEQALIAGDLSTDDLPAAWDDAYESVLGIRSPTVADGVLQDVHWSAGLFGYFPTYTLGNLVSAQLYEAAEKALGDLPGAFRKGDFVGLLSWLRENVHAHGRCYSPDELVERATGEALTAQPLIKSLRDRYLAG
ncbi:MAG: carboxypeptidase M32 [Planctomycetota bacterium]